MTVAVSQPTLVIGYGNPLRGDDAAGRYLVAQLATCYGARVSCLSLHQLTPDLAADIAAVERVIFVDASSDVTLRQATLEPLLPSAAAGGSSHHLHPATLLALTQSLYGLCPTAFLLGLPAQSFDLSESLSVFAAQGVAEGFELLRDLLVQELEDEYVQAHPGTDWS